MPPSDAPAWPAPRAKPSKPGRPRDAFRLHLTPADVAAIDALAGAPERRAEVALEALRRGLAVLAAEGTWTSDATRVPEVLVSAEE